VPRERAESKQGCEQNPIGKGPLKNYLRDFIEKVQKDQVKGRLIFNKSIHPLEKEDDDVDEDQAPQA
jgi:hypothetical protein